VKQDIKKLSDRLIFLGTSSWKYPGWKGLVYEQPYTSEKKFKDSCLQEYSKQYPTVGVDHTYYAWPTEKLMKRYFEETPNEFKFILKATDQITVPQFPRLTRYGKNAGTLNPTFLDANHFFTHFLVPVENLKHKLGAIVLEFSRFRPGMIERGSEFVEKLDLFLEQIRSLSNAPIAVEIRNSNWLQPTYFTVLKRHSVSHVFNSWTYMPEVKTQWELARTSDFSHSIIRLLLKPGVLYEEAVNRFSPYDKIQEVQTEIRNSVIQMIRESLTLKKTLFVLVNNRFEGCAPKTIDGLLKEDLLVD
jgi:uncharacterized protein YecE (DUF72 family)